MFKKIAIAVGVVALIGGAVFFYYFRQATALPEWYEEELALEVGTEPSETGGAIGWEPLEGDDDAPGEDGDPGEDPDAVVNPPSVGQVDGRDAPPAAKRKAKAKGPRVMRGFHRRRAKKGQKTAVKASRATYDKGKLEAGVVLDLSRVPKDKFTPGDKELYNKAVRGFPGITKRDVYVGIEDRPVTKDGVLQLGSSPKVRVGNLRYSIASAASKLGMSEAQLRRDFNNELRRMGFTDPGAR